MAQRDTGQPQQIMTVTLPGDNNAWGQLNKYDLYSRISIPDTDFDEFQNFIPMGNSFRQTPTANATIATLAASAIWMSAQTLNAAQYIFALASNGHIYQVAIGGTITDVSGATSVGANADIANWQGTTILFTDPAVGKIYSWNGTTFATVFSSQTESIIAVYANRLWMANANTVTFTAGGTFNSLGGDAGAFTITQSDAQPPIIAMYPFSGLLYIFGYDWVMTLGNVYDVGSPAVTTFQLNMIENRVGTKTRWSIIALGSTLYWANNNGIWALQGTFPSKISSKLDGFWQGLGANANLFAAYGYIYNIPCLFWQCQWTGDGSSTTVFGFAVSNFNQVSDQTSGVWFRTVLSGEKFITSIIDQTNSNSKVFGCDGTNIFQMYANTSAAINSTFGTKYFNFGSPSDFKRMYRLGLSMMLLGSSTVTVSAFDESGNNLNLGSNSQSYSPTVIFLDRSGNPITWTAAVNITWTAANAPIYQFLEYPIDDIARKVGLQVVVNGAGNILESVNMEFESAKPKWGR